MSFTYLQTLNSIFSTSQTQASQRTEEPNHRRQYTHLSEGGALVQSWHRMLNVASEMLVGTFDSA